ncbi:MAG: hypothetical protein MHM6MM_001184 [Cercozoa sp. M6MM]
MWQLGFETPLECIAERLSEVCTDSKEQILGCLRKEFCVSAVDVALLFSEGEALLGLSPLCRAYLAAQSYVLLQSLQDDFEETLVPPSHDGKGIIYELASRVHGWRHPSRTLGLVTCTSTPLLKDSADIDTIFERTTSRIVTGNMENNWVKFQLHGFAVKVTHYAIRHYRSFDTEALRNWALEGFNEETSTWNVLSVHKNDCTITHRSQWYIFGANQSTERFYTQLRLRQTGLNSNNHNLLAIGGAEFFGTVREMKCPLQPVHKRLDFDPSVVQRARNWSEIKGILNFLGTVRGNGSYRNPAATEGCFFPSVRVALSSKGKRCEPPSALLSTKLVRCVTKSRPDQSVVIDLGKARAQVSAFALQHYASFDTECLRNFVLEGSNTARDTEWVILSKHTNARELDGIGSIAAWKTNKNSDAFFRFFRLRQTGENSNQHSFLALSSIEFFGAVKVASVSESLVPKECASVSSAPSSSQLKQVDFAPDASNPLHGLLYFLGTVGGSKEWRNPATVDEVRPAFCVNAASSWMHDALPVVHLTSMQAGRLVTRPRPDQWISVCLPSAGVSPAPQFNQDTVTSGVLTPAVTTLRMQARLTHIALRHYSSWDTEALRNFVVEGSNNGVHWHTLGAFENNATLRRREQVAVFPLTRFDWFSAFRVRQTGPNSNRHHYLSCSGVEFFGSARYDELAMKRLQDGRIG